MFTSTVRVTVLVPIVLLGATPGAWGQEGSCPPSWVPTFGGVPESAAPSQDIRAMAVFDDGSGHGAELHTGALAWDGAHWRPVGAFVNLVDGPAIAYAFRTFDDGSGPALYVGGSIPIDGHGNVARWNGVEWSGLSDGVNGTVYALEVFDDGDGPALYVGGQFTTADSLPVNGLARWDGAAWTAVSTGSGMTVRALAVFDDGNGAALYAAGSFTSVGGVALNRIARWDGTNWTPLGTGTNADVNALAVYDDGLGGGAALYAAGAFTSAGGAAASFIARWDGTSWTALGAGTTRSVRALEVFDAGNGPVLCASTRYTTPGGFYLGPAACWNGSSWAALSSTADDTLHGLCAYDDGSGAPRLFAARGSLGAPLRWADSWGPMASDGVQGWVADLEVFDAGDGPALYATGGLNGAGDLHLPRIGKWNGTEWSSLGSGIHPGGMGWALATFDDGAGEALYVTGWFTVAGGEAANYIARWDGTSWAPLGSGLGYPGGRALAPYDDGGGEALYAGGLFATAGGAAASAIARWNGASWAPLAAGLRNGSNVGSVNCLCVFDDGGGAQLYAGGSFNRAGSVLASNLARWDGTAWSAVGGGANDIVEALLVHDDGSGPALYAAGRFDFAGGILVNGIARWDGTSWSAVGAGVQPQGGHMGIQVLATFDDGTGGGPALYAGGAFLEAGAAAASCIARWDGTSWSPLGQGMLAWSLGTSGYVRALAAFDHGQGPGLYAGGQTVHSVESGDASLALWRGCVDQPPVLAHPSAVHAIDRGTAGEVVFFTVTASDALDPAPVVVCTPPSGSLFPTGTTVVSCTATDAAGHVATGEFPVHVVPSFRSRTR